MVDVLSHPLGPLSWALATADGYLRKTNQSALAKYLQTNIAPPSDKFLCKSASVIGARSLVQNIRGGESNFSEADSVIQSMALKKGSVVRVK